MTPFRNQDIDQLASSYGEDVNPDVEAALSAVKRRLMANDKPAAIRRMPSRRSWLGAAAAVLLLLVAGYFGMFWNTDELLVNSGTDPLEVQLPDGTEVTLQGGSSLSYANDFNDKERRVSLDGQAFFIVHKDASRPFLVGNTETELRVTGTEFNLRVEGGELEVEVSEGSVELRKEDQVLAVKAKQRGVAKSGKPSFLIPAPHLNRHAWRTGKLYFQDAELAVVLEALRTNFGIVTSVEGRCSYVVSGTYSAEDPLAILRNVARLGGGEIASVPDKVNTFQLVGACN